MSVHPIHISNLICLRLRAFGFRKIREIQTEIRTQTHKNKKQTDHSLHSDVPSAKKKNAWTYCSIINNTHSEPRFKVRRQVYNCRANRPVNGGTWGIWHFRNTTQWTVPVIQYLRPGIVILSWKLCSKLSLFCFIFNPISFCNCNPIYIILENISEQNAPHCHTQAYMTFIITVFKCRVSMLP
jgi:hypothetical protein